MIIFLFQMLFLLGLFFLEDYLVYKWIRKIDKKEREYLNEWETEYIKSLLKLKGEE